MIASDVKSLIQLCFPPLCAYNSLPDPTERASNIKVSLSYSLYKNGPEMRCYWNDFDVKLECVKRTTFSPAKGRRKTVSQKSLPRTM